MSTRVGVNEAKPLTTWDESASLINIWLVVKPTPLKNMSSSVGVMKFLIPNIIWEKQDSMVPNHQPVVV